MKLYFSLNFNTKVGEKLQLLIFEHNQEPKIHFLHYTENGNWKAEVDYFSKSISYKYQLTDEGGNILDQEFSLHHLNLVHSYSEYRIYDAVSYTHLRAHET